MRNRHFFRSFLTELALAACVTTLLTTAPLTAGEKNEKETSSTTVWKKEETQRPAIKTKADGNAIPLHKRYRHIDPKTGYRIAYYRAALPKTVPGGTRINAEEAFTHFQNKTALFLDVMAHTGTGPDPIDGHWRLSEPRQNIPGSMWLADVGTGTLTPEMQVYFRTNLEKLTKGDKAKTLILYCTADCWMAWNAVQRAAKWGYTNLLWFPDGTDEWRDQGHPLSPATPVPITLEDAE